MTKKFQIFLGLYLAAFFVLGVFAVTAIGNIHVSYDGGSYHGMDENYLAVRIAEELAKQRDKLFLETDAAFAALDPDTLQGEFEVTALPREYGANTTARLTVRGQTVAMEWDDGMLAGRLALPLDALLEGYRIALTTDGVTRVEVFETEDAFCLRHGAEIFSSSLSYGGGEGIGDVRSEREMNLSFYLDEGMLPFGDKARSVRIFAEKQGKEIFSAPMVNGVLEAFPTFSFEIGVPILIFAEVKGESGLTYRYLLQSALQSAGEFMINAGYVEYETGPFLTITTPDGKMVDLTR